jgi:hypothetical protein
MVSRAPNSDEKGLAGYTLGATCGLRISDSPTSDNLIPQETTIQDVPEMGTDGDKLSCFDSSVVADADD